MSEGGTRGTAIHALKLVQLSETHSLSSESACKALHAYRAGKPFPVHLFPARFGEDGLENIVMSLAKVVTKYKVTLHISGIPYNHAKVAFTGADFELYFNQFKMLKIVSMLPYLCTLSEGERQAWARRFCETASKGSRSIIDNLADVNIQDHEEWGRAINEAVHVDTHDSTQGGASSFPRGLGQPIRLECVVLRRGFHTIGRDMVEGALESISPLTKGLHLKMPLDVEQGFMKLKGLAWNSLEDIELTFCEPIPLEEEEHLQLGLAQNESWRKVSTLAWTQIYSHSRAQWCILRRQQPHSFCLTSIPVQITIRGVGWDNKILSCTTLEAAGKSQELYVYWKPGFKADDVHFILGLHYNVDSPSRLQSVHFDIYTCDCRMYKPCAKDLRQSFPSSLKHLSLRASSDNHLAVEILGRLIGDLDKTLSTLTVSGLRIDRLMNLANTFKNRSTPRSFTSKYSYKKGFRDTMVLTFA